MTCQLNEGETLRIALPNGDILIIDCRDPDPCIAHFVNDSLVNVFYPDSSLPPIPRSVIE